MDRIPEPELMDGEAQARAYAEADFEEPHSRVVRLLRELLPDLPAEGAALDLGCGPADISIRVARALPSWRIDGIDASEPMLRLGREAIAKAGLADRVRLVQGYLPDAIAPRERYDLVFSNSLLHHLHEPSALWQCVRRWASPHGAVFIVDLLRPDSREAAQRFVDVYSGGEPEVLRHDFFNSLLAAYLPGEVESQLLAAGLQSLRIKAVSDRHLAVWGRVKSE